MGMSVRDLEKIMVIMTGSYISCAGYIFSEFYEVGLIKYMQPLYEFRWPCE